MMRSGQYVKQASGYSAFVPAPLPPSPPVSFDHELARLMSEADRSLARLDGVTSVLPDPDLFVAMYVRDEAVLSSQIEGTQSTLEDVLQFEIGAKGRKFPKDIREVVNHVDAMNYGLDRLESLPLSLRLIREIHARLLAKVRGGDRSIGEFRRTQNWIGPAGCSLSDASFVPPPVQDMRTALSDFEGFLYDERLPVLIHCGLAHAQFETIHPFLDGNGRIGRLLITFLLCRRGVLKRPLLYLSAFLKKHRAEYYDRLTAIREDGNWEGWLKFFLRGVDDVSRQATQRANSILKLHKHTSELIQKELHDRRWSSRLLDFLFKEPLTTVRRVQDHLDCSYATARKIVVDFQKLSLLRPIDDHRRDRSYLFGPYLDIFNRAPSGGGSGSSETQTGTAPRAKGSAT